MIIKRTTLMYLGLAFMALVLCHSLLALKPIRTFSPTYDEPVHLTAGYIYWKTGDYRYNGYHHPPFAEMWAAIPLLWMKVMLPVHDPRWIAHVWNPTDQYQFADIFLYKNTISADRLMFSARIMQLVLSVGLGIILMGISFLLGGSLAAVIAGLFWAFLPTFLMQASIVSTDFAFAIFYFLFFCSALIPQKWIRLTVMGLSLGLCLASKYFSVLVLFVWGVIAVFRMLAGRGRRSQGWFKWIADLLIMGLIGVVTLSVVTQFNGLGVWWDGMSAILGRSQAGRGSFFWGTRYLDGSLFYFPALFLTKTPIPLLLGLALSLFFLFRKNSDRSISSKKVSTGLSWANIVMSRLERWAVLWIPSVVFFCVACVSKVQIGHRHILAIYPFAVVLAAVALSRLSGITRHARWVLMGWLIWGTFSCRPYFLGYFNEFIGGVSNGYRYFTDSNVDWGQSLGELSSALEPDDVKKGIYLAYFGVADPHFYGLKYIDVGSDQITGRKDDGDDPDLRPTKLAISATHLQGTYYKDPKVFSWLEKYPVWKVVGNSIFVFDFSQHPDVRTILDQFRRR